VIINIKGFASNESLSLSTLQVLIVAFDKIEKNYYRKVKRERERKKDE